MGFTILVIESDHEVRVSLRQTLEAEGYCVQSTTNGIEAVEFLKKVPPPNFVLLNPELPSMSADKFLQMKQQDAELRPIPVIELRKPLDFKKLISELHAVFGAD